ncbi:hypothetical protein LV89_01720 [Arcicella aurantiaca]|uniref:Prevent-host-death protein n=1 Tax=Arcicella aurantiaca TaxID=591202 RepID=A0A316EBA6_9BACT|nr:hypothetical protein [Arcicella aurantiaca]PWK27407.1 hypothetical protein LV89_01720 [Arcicella aurantiaca]
MDLQYISDTEGRHTAVVIPIEEWNNITAKHEDLKHLETSKSQSIRQKPSDFFGTLSKEEGEKMQAYVTQSRNEWERDI